MSYYIPANPCFSNTPSNGKKFYFGFHDNYFLKTFFDEKSQNIIIICYDTTELENKRYEIKLNKIDLNNNNRIFKIYDDIEEIYEFVYEIFQFNRYKITISKDDILLLELNFIMNVNNNKIDFKVNLEIKSNAKEDFISDFNYILRNEIINLKKKYNKEISDLKFQNKYLIEELNKVKQIINDLGYINKVSTCKCEKKKKVIDKDLNLNGQNLDNKYSNMINFPDLEGLILSNYNKESKVLNLSKTGMNNISKILNKTKFQSLDELYLSQNEITELEFLTKFDLTNIQKIDLSFNCIDDINIFYRIKAPKLKYLNLSHNNIKEINIFGTNFNDLEELYLDNNKIDQDLYYDLIDYLRKKLIKFTW